MRQASSPQIVGRYEIYGKIASGGMATVHFGRLLGGAGFSRTVAIKRLHPHLAEDPAFCASILDEARLAARIHHPNVVPTLDVVSEEGELLLVMEYVRGESLAQAMMTIVGRGERMPLSIASAITVGALHGLQAAHEATSDLGEPLNIVHRDVSPQNILIGTDGLARVIDFGVAKGAGRVQTTREGVIKGKFAYMAPEQLAARKLTRTADVYAMGVVLWEMLACRRLFDGNDESELMGSLMAGATEPPSKYAPGLPAALDALVMKALAPDPAARFASTREMAEELAALAPPAAPTELGAWCANVAKDSLAKRAAAVAEIESNGATSAPFANGAGSPEARSVRDRSGSKRTPAEGAHEEDVAPTIASQPASAALGTPPAPASAPRRRAIAAAIGGAALLVLVIGVAQWAPWNAAAPAVDSKGASVGPIVASPAADPTEVAPPSSPAASVTGVAPVETTNEPPPSAAPPTPPRPTAPRPQSTTPPTPVAPAAPRPAGTCNPPYVFDSHGNKKWKRQCL